MKRFRATAGRRGVILLFAALLMVFVAGVAAFAIDCGTITLARTQLQAAADAAALAGANVLSTSTTAATTAATTIAQANYAGGTHVSVTASSDVEFGDWDTTTSAFTLLTGSAASSGNAVRVTCRMSRSRGTGLTLFFAPIYGKSTTDVSAQAIAMKAASSCGFIGLNSVAISGGGYTDSYNSSSSAYSSSTAGKQGNVCSNGNISISSSTAVVNGDAHPGIGMSVSTGSASVTGSTQPLTQALVEAAVDTTAAATTNDNLSIPKTSKGVSAVNKKGQLMLSAGDSLTLPAGTFYFTGISLSGNSTVNMSGKTIVYCTGTCDTSGGSFVNASQIPSNFQLDVTGSKCSLSGNASFYGEVYAPASAVTWSGNSDFFGSMVGLSLTLSGGGGIHYDTALGMLTTSSATELVK